MPDSATLEKPDAPMVSKPDTTVVYMARRSELKLVLRPERKRHDAEGNAVETIPGVRLAFREGVLRVPRSGTTRGEKGESVKAEEVHAFLEAHPLLGDRLEGFWRLHEPPPAPTEAEQSRLAELGIEL